MSWGVVVCKDMGWGAMEEGWRKGPWTAEEDRLLMEYVKSHGEGRWNKVCRLAGLQRNGKSCRLRWVNYLRPDLKKGQITPHEERIILDLHARWGNRWSSIARSLPGRTDNEIKNYWRTHFKKSCKSSTEKRLLRRQQFQQQQQQHEQAQMDMKKMIESLKGNFNQEVMHPTAFSDEERSLYSMSSMISNYALASNEENLWDGLWNLGDLHGNYAPGKPVYPNNFASSTLR